MKDKLKLASVSIIFCFSLMLIVGIFRNGILLFGDTDLTYHFGHKFFSFNNLYVWNDYFQSGLFDFNKFQGFYLKKIIYLINITINNLYIFSYLWYFLSIFLYVFTFYFLIKEIVKNYILKKKFIIAISLLLGLFSVFNGIFVLYAGQVLFVIALIMINIFFLYFLKNINFIKEHQKNNYGYLIIMAIAISEASIYLQAVFLLIYAAVIFGLLNYKFILKYFRPFLTLFLLVSSIVILLNFQWIIVLFEQFINNSAMVGELIKYDVDMGWKTAESVSNNIYMQELLRLKSYHVFNQIPTLFYFIGYAPIFIILGYFLENKKQKDFVFLSLLFLLIISIFLSYGVHPITKSIYMAFWDNIPLFNTFRTIMKFSFILLYVIIFLLAIVLAKTKNIKIFTIISLLLFLNCLFSISYYTQLEFARNMEQYKIPDYYFEVQARNFDGTDKIIGNNILLPQTNWQYQYKWAPKKVDSMNILPYFYGKGNFVNGAQYEIDPQYLYNDYFNLVFRGGFSTELSKLLRFRNIKYITYQDDLRFPSDETQSPTLSDKPTLWGKPLLKNVNLTLNKNICSNTEKIGELIFCKINNSIFTPLFSIGNEKGVVIKKQAHIDLFQEIPTVLTDLSMLELFRDDVPKFFETDKKIGKINHSAEIYMSMRPYVTQNCYDNGLPGNIYFVEDIPEGDYEIYFRHYPITAYYVDKKEYIQKYMNQGYEIEVYDNVDSDYINKSIKDFTYGVEVQMPKKYESLNIIDYYLNENNASYFYLGKFFIKGNNVVIRTSNNNYFSFGRFYFINNTFLMEPDNNKNNKPIIEFKKVNPTKYRVIVHQAQNPFSLLFSENFHKGWKAYLVSSKPTVQSPELNDLEDCKILDGNEEYQASREELEEFIKKGWVSTLGDKKEHEIKHKKYENGKEHLDYIEKYNIDFISKNFQGAIQNDNLPNGHFYETWLKRSIENNSDHLMANGYANFWIIDPEKIYSEGGNKCVKNSDGTYDFEIVVEFWPQRLFYLGLLISGGTLLGCLGYLFYDWRGKKIECL
jgi:hypothetical protein